MYRQLSLDQSENEESFCNIKHNYIFWTLEMFVSQSVLIWFMTRNLFVNSKVGVSASTTTVHVNNIHVQIAK